MIPTPLRASRVLERLGGGRFSTDLRHLGSVGSTSDVVRTLAERGAPDGTVVVAEAQEAGRGRRGSRWRSPAGQGLWFSLLLRGLPPGPLRPLLPVAAGVAVAEVVRGRLGLPARVKWPNDVLVLGRKVAGVLVELVGLADASTAGILGIGVNTDAAPGELPAEAPLPAGSLAALAGARVDREELLAALLSRLEAVLAELRPDAVEGLLERFRALDALLGRDVTARSGDAVLDGRVVAVDPREGLTVELTSGERRLLRAEHTRILSMGPERDRH